MSVFFLQGLTGIGDVFSHLKFKEIMAEKKMENWLCSALPGGSYIGNF